MKYLTPAFTLVSRLRLWLLVLAAWSLTSAAAADPLVPGFLVTHYATVTDPFTLSFDPAGNLYVGRDNSGSGGENTDPVRIHRVGPGGSPVREYGDTAIADPDIVLFDSSGLVSGSPGTVLVGGIWGSSQGHVTAIRPDETTHLLYGPTSTFFNPAGMIFDATGRLLLSDAGSSQVFVSDGAGLAPFFSLAGGVNPHGLCLDSDDTILSSASDSKIRRHDPTGTLVNGEFSIGAGGQLALGPGSPAFGDDLYAWPGIWFDSTLVRIGADGSVAVFGTGFTTLSGIAFGPDGALYVSEFDNDRVLRIATDPSAVSVPQAAILDAYSLSANPSPFRSKTHLRFHAAGQEIVRLTIHDVRGRLVKALLEGSWDSGNCTAIWNGHDSSGRRSAPGVYFARLQAGEAVLTTKVVLVK